MIRWMMGALLILGPSAPLLAGAGESAVPFLEFGSGARPMAMGNAFTAVAEDTSLLKSNVGGLSLLHNDQFSFTYASYLENTRLGHAAYLHPNHHRNAFGIQLLIFDYGPLSQTSEDATGNFGQSDGQFAARDLSLEASYGRSFMEERLGWGLTFKYLQQTVDVETQSGWATDVGLHWKNLIDHVSSGLAIHNVGPDFSGHPLPTTIAGGLATDRFKPYFFTADVVKPLQEHFDVRFGIEFRPVDVFAVRLGYRGDSDVESRIKMGLGFEFSAFDLDYAFAPSDDFSSEHRMTLTHLFD